MARGDGPRETAQDVPPWVFRRYSPAEYYRALCPNCPNWRAMKLPTCRPCHDARKHEIDSDDVSRVEFGAARHADLVARKAREHPMRDAIVRALLHRRHRREREMIQRFDAKGRRRGKRERWRSAANLRAIARVLGCSHVYVIQVAREILGGKLSAPKLVHEK